MSLTRRLDTLEKTHAPAGPAVSAYMHAVDFVAWALARECRQSGADDHGLEKALRATYNMTGRVFDLAPIEGGPILTTTREELAAWGGTDPLASDCVLHVPGGWRPPGWVSSSERTAQWHPVEAPALDAVDLPPGVRAKIMDLTTDLFPDQ